jgi:hypothetical protein
MHASAYNATRNTSLAASGKLDTIMPEHAQDGVDAGVNGVLRASLQATDSFVREPECRLITGLSRVTRWRLEREGKFPRRRRLSTPQRGISNLDIPRGGDHPKGEDGSVATDPAPRLFPKSRFFLQWVAHGSDA